MIHTVGPCVPRTHNVNHAPICSHYLLYRLSIHLVISILRYNVARSVVRISDAHCASIWITIYGEQCDSIFPEPMIHCVAVPVPITHCVDVMPCFPITLEGQWRSICSENQVQTVADSVLMIHGIHYGSFCFQIPRCTYVFIWSQNT
jgi:hypothetical protein